MLSMRRRLRNVRSCVVYKRKEDGDGLHIIFLFAFVNISSMEDSVSKTENEKLNGEDETDIIEVRQWAMTSRN